MASDDTYVGQILLFPFNFAPQGFAMCRGQLMPIASNTALFALLGTRYGGDGKSTFGLPDLRGRVPLKAGQGAGLTGYGPGEQGGLETVTLSVDELPQHAHALGVAMTATARCSSAAATQASPVGTVPAVAAGASMTFTSGPADANMSAAAVALGGTLTAAAAGGGQAHDNRQPCLALNYCIALQGVFPSGS
jgi:microcystin-dependent protein